MKKIIAIVALVAFASSQSASVMALGLTKNQLVVTNGGEKDKEKAKENKDGKACCKKEGKACCNAPKTEGGETKDVKAQPQVKEKTEEQPKK